MMAHSPTPESPLSLVASMILPAALQSRLRPLRSVRAIVTVIAARTTTAGTSSSTTTTTTTATPSPPTSQESEEELDERELEEVSQQKQEPAHRRQHHHRRRHTAVFSQSAATAAVVGVEVVDRVELRGPAAVGPGARTAVVGELPRRTDSTPSSSSGVNWKLARQGTQLLKLARDEVLHRDDDWNDDMTPDADGSALERKAFVDGVSCLLRALPRNLDEGERRTLGASLAPALSPPSSSLLLPLQAPPPSWLHRAVRSLVSAILVLLHLLYPLAALAMQGAARADRRYHVSRTLVGGGLGLAGGAIGHLTAAVCGGGGKEGGSVWHGNNGNHDDQDDNGGGGGRGGRGGGEGGTGVARCIGDGFAWMLEGVAAGLTEGVDDGLERIRRQRRRDGGGGEWPSRGAVG